MVWISIASEAVHFTDGRPSLTGDLVLMGVAAGLVAYCTAATLNRVLCERIRKYFPLVAAAFCLVMLLPFAGAVLSILYGIACGLFLASALIGYLPHAGTKRRMFKIGLSAGIYTTAVYPFGVAYTLLSPFVPSTVLRLVTFLLLAALAIVIGFLNTTVREQQTMRTTAHTETASIKTSGAKAAPTKASGTEVTPARATNAKYNPAMILMVVMVVVLAVLNHLLNSGVLEQNGGTVNAPLIFFVNVALRLPMGALMGYLADRGRWHYAVGLPLTLMIGGCAVSLFAGGAVGDYAMLGAFNCGGAAVVMLIHILGMQTALWRNGNVVAACFGSLTHFVLVAFFNMNTLGISPEFFSEILCRPLTFAVIAAGLPTFWLIMHFLVNERLREVVRTFFDLHPEQSDKVQPSGNTAASQIGFSAREQDVAMLLIEGSTPYEIARRLHLPSADVDRYIKAIQEKVTGGDGSGTLVVAAAREYHLTRRETDMLRCLQSGMTNGEIADLLVLSEETVKIHVRNLLRKLSLDSRFGVKAWIDIYAEKMK
jgi:DNA-binding NarL/FixJ family response regulator